MGEWGRQYRVVRAAVDKKEKKKMDDASDQNSAHFSASL